MHINQATHAVAKNTLMNDAPSRARLDCPDGLNMLWGCTREGTLVPGQTRDVLVSVNRHSADFWSSTELTQETNSSGFVTCLASEQGP
jgi:hypothetical protein